MTTEKRCNGCQVVKPGSEFNANPRAKDGLRARCKTCSAAYSRRHYVDNRAKVLQRSSERYAGNKTARNAQQQAWYRANRETQAQQQRQRAAAEPGARAALVRDWRARNKERDLENGRIWREANRDRIRASGRRRYAENPEKFLDRGYRRRAVVASPDPVDYAALWTGICGICEGTLDPVLSHPNPMSKSVDHIVPLARGGEHSQENVQWAHLVCNLRKGARQVEVI